MPGSLHVHTLLLRQRDQHRLGYKNIRQQLLHVIGEAAVLDVEGSPAFLLGEARAFEECEEPRVVQLVQCHARILGAEAEQRLVETQISELRSVRQAASFSVAELYRMIQALESKLQTAQSEIVQCRVRELQQKLWEPFRLQCPLMFRSGTFPHTRFFYPGVTDKNHLAVVGYEPFCPSAPSYFLFRLLEIGTAMATASQRNRM